VLAGILKLYPYNNKMQVLTFAFNRYP